MSTLLQVIMIIILGLLIAGCFILQDYLHRQELRKVIQTANKYYLDLTYQTVLAETWKAEWQKEYAKKYEQ